MKVYFTCSFIAPNLRLYTHARFNFLLRERRREFGLAHFYAFIRVRIPTRRPVTTRRFFYIISNKIDRQINICQLEPKGRDEIVSGLFEPSANAHFEQTQSEQS